MSPVRRIVFAFGAFTLGEWIVGTAVAISAYSLGGALAVGLVGFRFVPAALAGLVTVLAQERYTPRSLLTATAAVRATIGCGVALALVGDAPLGIVVAFVWLDAALGSAYRPAQAALLPGLVRTPGELAAAAARLSNAKTIGQITGAVTGGLLLAVLEPAGAVAVGAALAAAGAVATMRLELAAQLVEDRVRHPVRAQLRRVVEGLAILRADHGAGWIAIVSCARSMLRGLWLPLGVIAGVELLDLGDSGFGVLMAAAAVGTVAAVAPIAALVGRDRLTGPLCAAMAVAALAIAGVGAVGDLAPALALLAVWGFAMSIADMAAQALLTRAVGGRELPRVVGVTESVKLLAEGAGGLLAPGLVALLGIRGALFAAGALTALPLLAGARRLRNVERRAGRRVGRLHLVRAVPDFAALRVDGLERVAAELVPERVAAGREVVTQGQPGSRWYLVEDGRLEIEVGGYVVDGLVAGGSFGERALLRDQPRAATVRAVTEARLLTLDRSAFLRAMLGDDVGGARMRALPPRDPAEALRRQHLLASLSGTALAALTERATIRRVAAAGELFSAGATDDCWFVVLDGEIEIRAVHGSWPMHPGDAFGEIAVLYRIPRTASAIARTAATVLSLPGDVLRAVLAPQLPADGRQADRAGVS